MGFTGDGTAKYAKYAKPVHAGFLSRVWRVSRFPLPSEELQFYEARILLCPSFTLDRRRCEDTAPWSLDACAPTVRLRRGLKTSKLQVWIGAASAFVVFGRVRCARVRKRHPKLRRSVPKIGGDR
jgi:hypothetical protein